MAKRKDVRKLKVYQRYVGTDYRPTPSIMLQGKWLEELGFEAETQISVRCEDGRLTIVPAAAEAENILRVAESKETYR